MAPRPFPPHHDLKGFYVAVSRVKRRTHLRVLHKPSARRGGFDQIKELRHTLELKIWNESYNQEGDYSVDCAKVAFAKYKDSVEPKKKRKTYKGPPE